MIFHLIKYFVKTFLLKFFPSTAEVHKSVTSALEVLTQIVFLVVIHNLNSNIDERHQNASQKKVSVASFYKEFPVLSMNIDGGEKNKVNEHR